MDVKVKGFFSFLCVVLSINLPVFAQYDNMSQEALIQIVDSINSAPFGYVTANTADAEIRILEGLILADSINYKKGKAFAHKQLALIYYYKGDYALSAEHNIKTISFFEDLGMLKEAAKQYSSYGYQIKNRNLDDAEFFVRKGMNISESLRDTTALVDVYDWYGVIKEFRQQLDSALYYYQTSFRLKEIIDDSLGLSYSHRNIAGVHFLNNNFDNALNHLEKAIMLSRAVNDSTGIAVNLHNSSYIYSAQNDFESAIAYLKHSLKISTLTNYVQLAIANYQYLTDNYEMAGKPDSALFYQRLYMQFSDSIRRAEADKTIAELEVQFKTEQKEKELIVKNAALVQEQLKVKQRTYVLFVLASLIICGFSIAYLIFRNQKIKEKTLQNENELRLQLANAEMENRIYQERERISRDLHDNVGSQITNLISGIEISNLHVKKNQKDEALGLLSNLDSSAREAMHELRDTIWLLDKDVVDLTDFIKHLQDYIKRVQPYMHDLRIKITNAIDHELELNPGQSLHLLRIIQECLNNCRKHSGSDLFEIQFHYHNEQLLLTCSDNGKGVMKDEIKDGGNGLMNIRRRVNELSGHLELKTTINEGFTIRMTFPGHYLPKSLKKHFARKNNVNHS